jgi:thiol-disulfide isomerase/thioredoxin
VSLSRPAARATGARGVVGLLLTVLAAGLLALPARAAEPVTLLFFGTETCPYCQQMELFLDDLEGRYGDAVRVERYEVANDLAARDRWVQEMAARGQEASGVPTTMLGETLWVGFSEQVAVEVDAAVAAAIETAEAGQATDPVEETPVGPDPPPAVDDAGWDTVLDVPLLGEVDAAARSALGATVLIALIDGFNPCSLWVLSVLLAMLLRTGSRGRIAMVGGAFLVTTAAVYGLFVAGVFSAMSYVGYLSGIRWAVALLALTFAAVNIKDYFAFKKGFSFTIPDRFKPRIYRGGRGLMDENRSLLAVTGAAVVMALGIALVELPCTAGFPVVWSGLLTDAGVSGSEFAGLLSVYLGIYLLD